MIIDTRESLIDEFCDFLEDYEYKQMADRFYCCICENQLMCYLQPFRILYFAEKSEQIFSFYCPCCGTRHNIKYKHGKYSYTEEEGVSVEDI